MRVRERERDDRLDLAHLLSPVGLEERLPEVRQREVHHLRLRVERRSVLRLLLPAGEHVGGRLFEDLRRLRDQVGMECGLRVPARVRPAVALGGDEAFADDRLQLVGDERRPRIVRIVVAQHPLHVIGVHQQVHGQRTAEVHDVAVLAPRVDERLNVVALDLANAPEHRVASRPRYRALASRCYRSDGLRHRFSSSVRRPSPVHGPAGADASPDERAA